MGRTRANESNWISAIQSRVSGAIMIGSWVAGLALCCLAVVSSHIAMRFGSLFIFGLMLAPSLVLALRQVERERQILALREQVVSEAPEQAELPDEEQSGIFVDESTGLASRRYMMMFLQREVSRSERANIPLSLAVFDVDRFHALEQSAGARSAATGLADMGARIESALRDYDLVARYADGRLAIVLPETGAQAAAEVVERLHDLAASVCVDGQRLSVTVGLAAFPEHGSSAEDLINSAHRALNRGKVEGANKVHTLEDLPKAA